MRFDAAAPRRAALAGDQGVTFVEYPDREVMMLSVANAIAGDLGDFLRREGRASALRAGRNHAGADLRVAVGR
jgi:hypothetical protein